MKEIKAYIRPHKLSEVILALHKVEGLSGMSVINAHGFGRGRAAPSPRHAEAPVMDTTPCVKIEILCRDELVEEVVSAIGESAHTGLRGDGKIYVTPVETAVRISTGERGETVV